LISHSSEAGLFIKAGINLPNDRNLAWLSEMMCISKKRQFIKFFDFLKIEASAPSFGKKNTIE